MSSQGSGFHGNLRNEGRRQASRSINQLGLRAWCKHGMKPNLVNYLIGLLAAYESKHCPGHVDTRDARPRVALAQDISALVEAQCAQIVAAERERLALLAESRSDGWHSLTPEEIRAGELKVSIHELLSCSPIAGQLA